MNKGNANFVLLSGGVDSTTVLSILMDDNQELETTAITLKYPSKHNPWERQAASDVAAYYKIPIHTIDLTDIFMEFESALLIHGDQEIPEGHYAGDNMKQTVVPIRNIIFASIVAGRIMSTTEDPFNLFLGIHAGDHAIYPDCRPETFEALAKALFYGSDRKVWTVAPILNLPKSEIVATGLSTKAPYHLTRTCYTSAMTACGKCGSCNERLEAFSLNGAEDPISYQK